jgi:hypothetical protein
MHHNNGLVQGPPAQLTSGSATLRLVTDVFCQVLRAGSSILVMLAMATQHLLAFVA